MTTHLDVENPAYRAAAANILRRHDNFQQAAAGFNPDPANVAQIDEYLELYGQDGGSGLAALLTGAAGSGSLGSAKREAALCGIGFS